jgi:hypothetical protein
VPSVAPGSAAAALTATVTPLVGAALTSSWGLLGMSPASNWV